MNDAREIVSDTGPLITLEKLADGYGFIRKLYDRILVPPSVLDELYQGQFVSPEAYLAHFRIDDLVLMVPLERKPELPALDILDPGERDAIALALERQLSLLIEETEGRRIAQDSGLHISGIAGQVFRAFREGLLEAEEAGEKLRELLHAGRINTRIYEGLLAAIRRADYG